MALLRGRTTDQLLRDFAAIMAELRDRGVVHSSNNPVADYAEYLVCSALALTPAPPSTKGFDAIDKRGLHYEIKGRRITKENPSRQLSAIRDIDGEHFDFLAVVLFATDFSVMGAYLVPAAQVKAAAQYRKHVNAWILIARDTLFTQKGVRDISDVVKRVAAAG